MRKAFINSIVEVCKSRDDIFILSGDAGLGVFDGFKEEYPDRFRNLGVAEQNTIGFAAGLALTGYKVIVYNIAPFVLYRCYEQVRNDICHEDLPVVLVGTGSGVTYAPMGISHYSVEDIGIAQTLPNLVTLSPMDPVEARAAARYALASEKPVYVRLAKQGEPSFHVDGAFDISAPQVIREGSGTAIVFHGSISAAVMEAEAVLRDQGWQPLIVSVPMVQPLDERALLKVLAAVEHVVCVEEHYVNCGLGSMIARLKPERSAGWSLTLMGIPCRLIQEVCDTAGLRSFFGIAAADIVRAVVSARLERE